jgi:hypothetical protein
MIPEPREEVVMLEFEPTREGYIVKNEQGRAICRIETRRVAQVKVTQPPDNRVMFIEEHERLPHDKWLFHFCAGKRTAAELTALYNELPSE